MKRVLLFFVSVLLFCSILIIGCTTPEEGNGEPTPVEKEFFLSFKFEKGSALFHKIRLTIERSGETEPIQVMETISLVRESRENFSELEMIVLDAYRLDHSERKDMCSTMPYSRKRGTVNFYPDGNVDYGAYSRYSFYLPQEMLKMGDSWESGGTEYKIEEETVFRNQAGEFQCVKISFDGLQVDQFGTKRTYGYFLFDPEKNLKVKEETIEERAKMKITSENELIRIEQNFSGEIDYTCVFSEAGLSLEEKFEYAKELSAENEFLISLELALSIRQDLEKIADLNQPEISLLKNTLMLIADNYQFLGEVEKEMQQRFENAKYLEKFLYGNKITVNDFKQALWDYEKVAESESGFAEEARTRLNDLNSRVAGMLKGNASLADTGKVEGLKLLLVEGIVELEYESLPFNPAYSIPILDLSEGNLFSAMYYRTGYKPKALPPIEIDENTFLGEYSVVLKRMDNNALGYLTGFCYSLDEETGLIKQFNDLNFSIAGREQEFEAECKNGFYSIALNPGPYTITDLNREIGIKQSMTTIAHIVQ